MAEAILSTAVGGILKVLGSQLLQDIQLATGVQEEIRELRDTFETINGVLLVAEKQFNNNEAVTVWLRRLKDAVYDADDLLDDFYTQLKINEEMVSCNKMTKEVRIFCSQSNQIAYSLKMGYKIKAIRERLERIKNDGQLLRFNSDHGNGVNYCNRQRETHSFECEENVIGRDRDKTDIIYLLLGSNDHSENNVSVIAIVGIGGVGKTTVAQSVFEKVETHFKLRIWVCVSDDFTLETIVKKILKSTDTEKEIENLEMDGLQKELREQIDGKKYLLVLDDVWNDDRDKWIQLHTLLKNGAKGSKILVTTRTRAVANIMTRSPLIYVLKGLTKDKSWFLFKKIAFEREVEPKDSSFEEIGKNIVAKCVGVPLAIRTIGNLLYGKDQEFWLSIRDQELLEIDQGKGDIFSILKLSYYHLSPPLKQCFAYCALFSKDHVIEKENLIQLWMAQGFLGTLEKNRCLEQIGNEYFMDLLSGSFLQDLREEELEGRKVITCKMHDLMHDLAQSVVGSEIKMITSDANSVDERTRHISFAPDLMSLKITTAMLKANNLRTFFPLCSYGELNRSHFNKIISNFGCLRILKLSHLGIKKVPTSIEKLKLLRYLNFSRNWHLKKLPNSMSKLINLQTLNLSSCGQLKKLPRDISQMVSLQYLIIDGCQSLTSMPHGIGQLTALRTLPLFVVGKRDALSLRELNSLNQLKGSLTIKVLGTEENFNLEGANLEEKQYLESIRLRGHENNGCDEVMVEALKPHPNLKELSIKGLGSVVFSNPCMSSFTKLTTVQVADSRCSSIMPLHQLPSLLSLTLLWLGSLEYISESDGVSNSSTSTPVASTIFFPSLKELTIECCIKLKGWWKINDVEDDQVTTTEKAQLLSFPRLSKLKIDYCPMLTCMPLYPTLEELDLRGTSTKSLQQTMKMKMKMKMRMRTTVDAATPSTSYSAFSTTALSNLKSLTLQFFDNLELPELLHRVTSLEKMHIHGSQRLISQLPQCIRYLSFLEHLIIGGYNQPDCLDDDDIHDKVHRRQDLGSLRRLNL